MLEIVERDLGDIYVEGYYTEIPKPALLALQPDLPKTTKQARIIEAHGYLRRGPAGRTRIMCCADSLSEVDEAAIAAMRLVVEDFLDHDVIERVRAIYNDHEDQDTYWLAWDCELHLHTVIAVVRNLQQRGEIVLKAGDVGAIGPHDIELA
jgi:hypothetical protein